MSVEPSYLSPAELATLTAAVDRLVPPDGRHPGGVAGGAVSYIHGVLDAFAINPPRIHGGGPFSGRAGGEAAFGDFMALSPLEELAWRIRIEGSQGIAEREFNGPVLGWRQRYREGLAVLGTDFATQTVDEQDVRLAANPEFSDLVYQHCCEGIYAAPEYGGNPNGSLWDAISYAGDRQPVGYTDAEVSGRD